MHKGKLLKVIEQWSNAIGREGEGILTPLYRMNYLGTDQEQGDKLSREKRVEAGRYW